MPGIGIAVLTGRHLYAQDFPQLTCDMGFGPVLVTRLMSRRVLKFRDKDQKIGPHIVLFGYHNAIANRTIHADVSTHRNVKPRKPPVAVRK